MADTQEAPKGVDKDKWERCVLSLKGKKGIDSPYAVCTAAMLQAKAEGREFDEKKDIEEAMSDLSHGALLRPGVKKESSVRIHEKTYFGLKESKTDTKGKKSYGVTIIRQGLGNLRDRNYYTESAIKSGEAVYEAKKAYYDHPTPTQEEEQPNRSVRELIGHYENVKAVKSKDGLWELNADLVPINGDSHKEAIEMLEHAVAYKKKYPDKDFVGVSINGDGRGEQVEYEKFLEQYKPSKAEMAKLQQVEGEPINAILELTDALSADIVSEPGAGGKINNLKESNFKKRRNKMLQFMKKFFDGVEKNDNQLIEAAVKGLTEDESKKKEDEAEHAVAQADSMVKHILSFKKESKKEDGESEAEYEKKAVVAAMKAMKQDEDEAKKKEDEDAQAHDKSSAKDELEDESKKEGDDKADGKDDEKKDDAKESDDADADDEKKDDKADGKGKDLAAMQKLMKQMQAEMEDMKKAMKQAEGEAKKASEEAAKAKTEITIKNREAKIEKALAECGLPYRITSLWKPVINKCKTEKEIEEVVKTMKETAEKVIEAEFQYLTPVGLVERAAGTEVKSNDDLFLSK